MTAERALITSLLFIPITRKGGIEIGVGIVIREKPMNHDRNGERLNCIS